MARVKVRKFEDDSFTNYFVRSKSLAQALNRATLLIEVLGEDNVRLSHYVEESKKKKHTLVVSFG